MALAREQSLSQGHSFKKFYSKVMLFGEYSVIAHSRALAFNYPHYEGLLSYRRDYVDTEISALSLHLKKLQESCLDFKFWRLAQLDLDLLKGLYFNSTIPQGHGLGSSGALTAAIYHQYMRKEGEKIEIHQLRKILAQIESHFHGASSGLDPLISYLGGAVLINEVGNLEMIELPCYDQPTKGGIFLLDTERSRKTEPLVNLFLEKMKFETFQKLCHSVLIPITDNCITSFLKQDITSLYEFWRELSDFQMRHFTPMIPKLFIDLWRHGLKTENYYLKLCGAGGGGQILGICRDFDLALKSLSPYKVRPIFYL